MHDQQHPARDALDDELDAALRRSAPAPLSDLDGVASKTTRFAQVVAGVAADRTHRRHHNVALLVGIAVSLVIVGATVVTAGPTVAQWVGAASGTSADRDVPADRAFPVAIAGSDDECAVVVQVKVNAAAAGDNAAVNLRIASEFLQDNSWSDLPQSSADPDVAAAITAAQAAAAAASAAEAASGSAAQATSVPTAPTTSPSSPFMAPGQEDQLRALMSVVSQRVATAYDTGGYRRPGITLDTIGQCDSGDR